MKKKVNPVEEQDQAVAFLEKARANRKKITVLSVVVLIVAAGLLCWYYVAQRGSAEADRLVGRADVELNDSIAQELYAQAAQSGYRSGNRAKAEMGIRLYQQGNYQEAAEYLGECSLSDNIAAAGVRTLEGDCYVNMENYDKAISCYNKAISKADGNPELVPFILVKMAHVYRAQGNFAEEADAYRQIVEDYPRYNTGNIDVRALYQRALRQAQN